MRKLAVLLFLSVGLCFAELSVDTQEKKFDIGFFVGGGIGIGANAVQYNNVPNSSGGFYEKNQSFASFVASVKVGAYHYFTPALGLRAYYNLDLNILPLDDHTKPSIGTLTPYILSASHTINADVIYNVFSQNNIDVAVIGGMGIGALSGEIKAKSDSVFYNVDNTSGFLDFEFRFNIGARAMFSKKYGVEFMAKLPVTPATRVNGSSASNIKYSPYYFTIDFVMEKF